MKEDYINDLFAEAAVRRTVAPPGLLDHPERPPASRKPSDPPFSITRARQRISELQAEIRSLKKRIRREQKKNPDSYYRTDHWTAMREKYCGPQEKCCGCGQHGYCQLHHIDYSRPYGERTGDLIRLCGSCHVALHDQLAVMYPKQRRARQATHTAKAFQIVFGIPFDEAFFVKIPGHAAKRSPAQKQAWKKFKQTRVNDRKAKRIREARTH